MLAIDRGPELKHEATGDELDLLACRIDCAHERSERGVAGVAGQIVGQGAQDDLGRPAVRLVALPQMEELVKMGRCGTKQTLRRLACTVIKGRYGPDRRSYPGEPKRRTCRR